MSINVTPDQVISAAVFWSFAMFVCTLMRLLTRVEWKMPGLWEDLGPLSLIATMSFFTGVISFRRWLELGPNVSAIAFTVLAISATLTFYRVWKRTFDDTRPF
jgi:hypothetical protein